MNHICADVWIVFWPQTVQDFELILVDDGSPDGCPAICDEYAQSDSRERVIHKPNGRLSDVRNVELDIARGAYSGCDDSDGYINSDMYEILIPKAEETKAEIGAIGYIEVGEEEDILKYCMPADEDRTFPRSEFMDSV